jgi:3'(2'), 5'-bisphosphate nucleotidase
MVDIRASAKLIRLFLYQKHHASSVLTQHAHRAYQRRIMVTQQLQDLFEIAHAAGRVIMDIYRSDFASRSKSDASPVTAADEAAEALIIDQLTKLFPYIPVIAEESSARGEAPPVNAEFFLVDPLDGTKEFINRNGEFTVNIALIKNQEPVHGVIYAPATGEAFCGSLATGAFRARVDISDDASKSSWNAIRVNTTRTSAPIAIASRSHVDQHTEAFLMKACPSVRMSRGSSLKFCAIACGEADIYPRYGRTMEWDTAAGQAILEAAGGYVTDMQGNRLLYGKVASNLANPAYLASSFRFINHTESPLS